MGYAENVLENKLCVKSCAGNLVSRHVKKKEWRSRAWMHYSGHQYACKETAQSKWEECILGSFSQAAKDFFLHSKVTKDNFCMN